MVGVNSYGYCDRICVALLLNFIFPFLIPSLPSANLTRMESIVLSLAIAIEILGRLWLTNLQYGVVRR